MADKGAPRGRAVSTGYPNPQPPPPWGDVRDCFLKVNGPQSAFNGTRRDVPVCRMHGR